MGAKTKHRVVIVGGGFGGVRTALELAKYPADFDVTVISDKPHFEYHAALYRVVTGRSPLEVCIPLSTIFESTKVKLVKDKIETVYPKTKQLLGQEGSKYTYDSVVLALGSQGAYFNIPGLKEHSFGLKSINDALKLKNHLHEVFTATASAQGDGPPKAIQIVLVGGGPTGVELAGELAIYARKMATYHKLSPNSVIIDLFEGGDRLVGMLDKKVSELALNRLRQLGVNIFLDTPIKENKLEAVYLADMKLKTKTLIWTAGVSTNELYAKVKEFSFDKRGRVMVDLAMQAKGTSDLYVIGDAAATKFGGLASSAIYDGWFTASSIDRKLRGRPPLNYQPKAPTSALPIGPGWAIVSKDSDVTTGRLGWLIRRWIDWKFFLSILPLNKALVAFSDGSRLTETCPICSAAEPTAKTA